MENTRKCYHCGADASGRKSIGRLHAKKLYSCGNCQLNPVEWPSSLRASPVADPSKRIEVALACLAGAHRDAAFTCMFYLTGRSGCGGNSLPPYDVSVIATALGLEVSEVLAVAERLDVYLGHGEAPSLSSIDLHRIIRLLKTVSDRERASQLDAVFSVLMATLKSVDDASLQSAFNFVDSICSEVKARLAYGVESIAFPKPPRIPTGRERRRAKNSMLVKKSLDELATEIQSVSLNKE